MPKYSLVWYYGLDRPRLFGPPTFLKILKSVNHALKAIIASHLSIVERTAPRSFRPRSATIQKRVLEECLSWPKIHIVAENRGHVRTKAIRFFLSVAEMNVAEMVGT